MDDYSPFDLDVMKRAMEPTPFEMSKKTRYGGGGSAGASAGKPTPSVAPSFENYGYGGTGPPQPHPQSMHHHHQHQQHHMQHQQHGQHQQMPGTPHMAQHNLAMYGGHPMGVMMTPQTPGTNQLQLQQVQAQAQAQIQPNQGQAGVQNQGQSQGATTAAPPSPYVTSPAMSMGYGMVGMPGMGMNNMGNMGMMGMGGMMNGMNSMNGMGMGMGSGMGGMGMFNVGGMGAFGYNPAAVAAAMGSFGQGGTPPGTGQSGGNQGFMQGSAMQSPVAGGFGMTGGHFNPAVAAAASAAANNATGRTVYIGSLPPSASVDELLNLVHFGPLESIRVLPNKSCVFLSFLDGATAAAFHADATLRKLTLHGQELKIGWGKASPVPTNVLMAITQSGASRNVYIGGLDEGMTEERLRDELSRFGLIDQVKIVRDKNIGFVHFLSIATATKVVGTLPQEPAWAGKRVNYGKDRCAYVPKSQQMQSQQAAGGVTMGGGMNQAVQAAQVAAAQSLVQQNAAAAASLGGMGGVDLSALGPMSAAAAAAAQTGMNRTIYLGNIHPDTTTEDICNAVRGGVLQSIRYMPDKHICFVTFIDAASAFQFFQSTTFHGLTINNRRVKIGWGKNSGGLPSNVALAVHGGATRNVYIGNIREEDWELFSEERLKKDFGEFGEIELVNFFKEKNCAFVNFTNISNAIKAIEIIKLKPEYASLRVSHGKDRCANPPRIPSASGGSNRRGGGERNQNQNGSQNPPSSASAAAAGSSQGVHHNESPEDPNGVAHITDPALSPNAEDAHLINSQLSDQAHIPVLEEEEEVFIPSENDKEEVGKLVQEQD